MNANQFAWAYLIKSGYAFASKSYYGGYEFSDSYSEALKINENLIYIDQNQLIDSKTKEYLNKSALELIQKIGIDWSKTKSPSSDFVSEFNGTFAEASTKEYLVGTIVLKNKTEINYSAEKEVMDVFEMMANQAVLSDFFEKYLK